VALVGIAYMTLSKSLNVIQNQQSTLVPNVSPYVTSERHSVSVGWLVDLLGFNGILSTQIAAISYLCTVSRILPIFRVDIYFSIHHPHST